MMADNKRFIWATNLIDAKPCERIMEIGCGTGILAQFVAEKSPGEIVAIDKSAAMIKTAQKRNAGSIESKQVRFLLGDFVSTQFEASSFDKLIAFNVNIFWKQPTTTLTLVKNYLKQDGKLYLFLQAPYDVNQQLIDKTKSPLVDNGFEIIEVSVEKLKPFSALCIIAMPTT